MKQKSFLLCDSGSTKSSWKVAGGQGDTFACQSAGLNPYFHTAKSFHAVLKKTFRGKPIDAGLLYFYGSGCGNPTKANEVKRWLSEFFIHAEVSVNSDILGAARALFGHQPGLTAIIGTGASMGFYSGEEIVKTAPSLGYVMGDEGSGAYFGKEILKAFLSGKMPEILMKELALAYPLSKSEFLDQIYRQPFPNRFLATFTYFIHSHQYHPWIQKMLHNGFSLMVNNMLEYFQTEELNNIGFVGSVGFIFQDEINASLKKFGLQAGAFIKDPIDDLCRYHLNV